MFCGILADTLLCPLPSSLLPRARYPRQLPWDLAPDEPLLTRWHLEGLDLGVSATALRYPSASRKVQRSSDSMDALASERQYKSAQANSITVLLSSGQTSRVKTRVHPQRWRELLPQGWHRGGLPMAWTVNNLVHGKGLSSLIWLHPPTPPLLWVSPRKRRWRANHWRDCFPTGSSTRCEEGDGDAGMGSPGGYT